MLGFGMTRHTFRGWILLAAGIALLGAAPTEAADQLSPEAQALLPLLKAADIVTRQAGFLQLEALREPATAKIVRQYAEDRSPDTRAFSLRALAAIEGSAAVPVLVEHLRTDRAPGVRVAALLALEPLVQPPQDPAAVEVCLKALRDRHPHVRMAAADVVSRLDLPEARAAVQRRWKRERNRDVRRVLEQCVARVQAPPKVHDAPAATEPVS